MNLYTMLAVTTARTGNSIVPMLGRFNFFTWVVNSHARFRVQRFFWDSFHARRSGVYPVRYPGASPRESYTSGQLLSESTKARLARALTYHVEEKWHNYDNWSRALGLCQPPARGRIPSINASRTFRPSAPLPCPRGSAWSAKIHPPRYAIDLPPSRWRFAPDQFHHFHHRPPWGRRARTTSNIRLATQLYCEEPTDWWGGRWGNRCSARGGPGKLTEPKQSSFTPVLSDNGVEGR